MSQTEATKSTNNAISRNVKQKVRKQIAQVLPLEVPRIDNDHETLDCFDPDQQRAVRVARSGKHLFVTGEPGTGKSHVCRTIIAEAERRHPGGVLVVAPTGVAALNLEGQTIHSKPGPGVPNGDTLAFRRMHFDKWKCTKVVVVDELSMIDAEFFEWYYETVSGLVSVQWILCGDFSQLPPIPTREHGLGDDAHLQLMHASRNSSKAPVPFGLKECSGKLAFQTAAWRLLEPAVVRLRRVHRTSNSVLLAGLADMRAGGQATPAVMRLVNETRRDLTAREGIEPTMLYSKRCDVDKENAQRLRALDATTQQVYNSVDEVEGINGAHVSGRQRDEMMKDSFFKSCQAQSELKLREGSQVMYLVNERPEALAANQPRLVNGSRGVVTGFEGTEDVLYPIVTFANGRVETIGPERFAKELFRQGTCKRSQLPLMPAWAITIHKSQGMSIDYLKVDLNGAFAPGQAYVAISRATCISGLQIVNFIPSCIKTSTMAQAFDAALHDGTACEYVHNVPTWWAPILNHRLPAWAEMYQSNHSFAGWERAFPQKRGAKREFSE